jgi:hypothetical protein
LENPPQYYANISLVSIDNKDYQLSDEHRIPASGEHYKEAISADYYDILNLGFHLTASAGSDLPWGDTIGEARVYAYTGKQFSAQRWYSALRKGHTFVFAPGLRQR